MPNGTVLTHPVGSVVKNDDGEELTVMGYIHYGDAGMYYIVLDEYDQEFDLDAEYCDFVRAHD